MALCVQVMTSQPHLQDECLEPLLQPLLQLRWALPEAAVRAAGLNSAFDCHLLLHTGSLIAYHSSLGVRLLMVAAAAAGLQLLVVDGPRCCTRPAAAATGVTEVTCMLLLLLLLLLLSCMQVPGGQPGQKTAPAGGADPQRAGAAARRHL
jgi:hypothetical protein